MINEKSFKGKVIYSPKKNLIKGKAFWVGSWETKFDNSKDEDILVCPKTDFIDVNKLLKFKAIVSGTGGLLSHAAIISREFKIPAIVGIGIENYHKIKRGDLIELNFETGGVKLL